MSKLSGNKHFVLRDYKSHQDMSEYEMNSKQAILAMCKNCYCFEWSEAKKCEDKKCPLYRFQKYYLKTKNKKIN